MKPKLALQLIKNMGLRYTLYRMRYELEKKSGQLKEKHPTDFMRRSRIRMQFWKANTPLFLFKDRESIEMPSLDKAELASLKEKAENIFAGKIQFYNNEWKDLGLNYDWVTNPETNFKYDNKKHWTEIDDFNKKSGDIKNVWEKSRFTHLLIIIRYDYYFNKDSSEFVFSEIDDWIKNNPVNLGPNWRCSQEISLRSFNWLYALYFYKNSKALTEGRFQKMMQVFYWSLKHVYANINFSRIAVRNNHAITETLFLSLSNMLFPFFKKSKHWASKGRKWFEQEINYQIYDDGTFLQFSMNYHRVVIQLLSFGLKISEIHKKPFSKKVYDKAHKSVNFLYQCLQEENGNLPNYGANDGALFFPLSETDFRDFRPQLNALNQILTKQKLFEGNTINEEFNWLNQEESNSGRKPLPPIKKIYGISEFKKGGYFLLREENTFTFIRCGSHKDRPSQADNLHIDIWVSGENVLRDGGSYKYNTEKKLQDYFMGTKSHNTVMVENESQMYKGDRFIWFYWTQAIKAKWKETDDSYIFSGKISAFRHLRSNAKHERIIYKKKNQLTWIVEDRVTGLKGRIKRQLWHPATNLNISNDKIKPKIKEGFYSSYYGAKEDSDIYVFEFDENIKTTISI